MGTGKKGKEASIMRRSVILSLTAIFAASSIAAAPVSFADVYTDGYGDMYESDNAVYDENGEEIPQYVEKDTSWFDYENPKERYEISTESELIGLASLVNEEQVEKWKPTRIENFEDVTFVLTDDIELTAQWNPIGTGGASYFAGTFDGNGHTISGLDISVNSGASGLFGYLVGTVKDLNIEGNIKSGAGNCGAVAGILASTGVVSGCTSDVKISAKSKTGGIVGNNTGGRVESCINTGDISGTYRVGGVVGENYGGVIDKCGNRGEVSSSRRGVGTFGTGGVAGRSVSAASKVTDSFNQGKIVSNTEATGGVVGYSNAEGAEINGCYNTGEINITDKGTIKGMADSYAGGVVGIVGTAGVTVRNCYNSALALDADVSGGVIGYYVNDSGNFSERFMGNNYYPSGRFSEGIGLVDNTGDRYVSDAATAISGTGFDSIISSMPLLFKSDDGIYGNSGYPVLIWQEPVEDDEKVYIEGVSKEAQKKLDEYAAVNTENPSYGHSIVRFFSLENYVNDAIISYSRSMEELESQDD